MKPNWLRIANEHILALLIRLLLAAALVTPAFCARAGVVVTTLHSFTGATNGAIPFGGLVQGSDGFFYGTTYGGTTNGFGTVFRISENGAFNTVYAFTGASDGANPHGALVQGRDGNFYGTTFNGGTNNFGTVFKIGTNGAPTGLDSFAGTNGYYPVAGVAQGSDGNLYGTTLGGAPHYDGTVFKISTNGGLNTLYSFTGGIDGSYPETAPVQGQDGNFYGTTDLGGTNNAGTVFKIGANGGLTSLYSFTGGIDGATPFGGLIQGSDGNLYGTTISGGTNSDGTVFQISTNGALTSLYSFTGSNDGRNPHAGLMQGGDGNFYGTTYSGGTYGFGTVFQIDTQGALTTLHSFSGGNDGANPVAALAQVNGSFYGTTSGGTNSLGTVFRLTMTPAFQAVTLTSNTLSLTWSTEQGGRYQLQYSADLNSGNWSNLTTVVTATGATLSATDSVTNAPHRFYRVMLSP
jgi:uncharacterized repeat protein (TIGR03803 family)